MATYIEKMKIALNTCLRHQLFCRNRIFLLETAYGKQIDVSIFIFHIYNKLYFVQHCVFEIICKYIIKINIIIICVYFFSFGDDPCSLI